ncbi:MAG: sugar nucleotide-binding protein [Candidatus Thermoplasmatota archaeon]|nr:sugar nucleotide-binding protein [Candidatus Thermoplasmatota archaeon]
MLHKNTSLIIGADGLIGNTLSRYLISQNEEIIETTRHLHTCTTSRIFLNLSDEKIDNWNPPSGVSVVYICAAVTSLEECRKDPHRSELVNVHNMIKIAHKCMKNGIFVIFLSTSSVFDGTLSHRKITDQPSPKTEYGRQKAEAERRLQLLNGECAIVRLTKVIDPDTPLIIGWIDTLKSNNRIYPLSDYVMAPISLKTVVECLYGIAQLKLRGIHHISAPNDISYAEAAFHIARRCNIDPSMVSLMKVSDSNIFLENNPSYTTLDTSVIRNKIGIEIPDAFTVIDEVFFQ